MTAQHPVGPQARIRAFRVAAGLTLEQLAERIEEHGVPVSVPHVSRVERGLDRPSPRLLRAWALALGLQPLDVHLPAPVTGVTDAPDVTDATAAA